MLEMHLLCFLGACRDFGLCLLGRCVTLSALYAGEAYGSKVYDILLEAVMGTAIGSHGHSGVALDTIIYICMVCLRVWPW